MTDGNKKAFKIRDISRATKHCSYTLFSKFRAKDVIILILEDISKFKKAFRTFIGEIHITEKAVSGRFVTFSPTINLFN